ncbi:Fe-S-containing protein [Patescibacteria group bacterium]
MSNKRKLKNSCCLPKGNSQVVLLLVGLVLIGTGLIYFFVKINISKRSQSLAGQESGNSVQDEKTEGELEAENEVRSPKTSDTFKGEQGETLQAQNNQVFIEEKKVSDGDLHAFNFYSDKWGKSLYFFIIKASDGTYRAAANACEVCFGDRKGFSQVGDQIRCETCRTMYERDQIALQRGGCNPRPISKDVPVVDGQLVLDLTSIEKITDLF